MLPFQKRRPNRSMFLVRRSLTAEACFAEVWCCVDRILRLPATVRMGGSTGFTATFTSAKLVLRRLPALCACVRVRPPVVAQNHTRGRFYASKRSKDNHFLEAFEIAEHLER